jgi:hypothetical protein
MSKTCRDCITKISVHTHVNQETKETINLVCCCNMLSSRYKDTHCDLTECDIREEGSVNTDTPKNHQAVHG